MTTPGPARFNGAAAGLDIAVVGAGIIGVTTAHELAGRGHRVTVYDRRESVGAEGSFANAGLLSAGSVSPASAPGLRPWLMRGLWSHEGALRWRPSFSMAEWRWLSRWWRACSAGHAGDVRAMVGLASLSQQRLQDLSQELGLQYERSQGVLLLLNHEREFRPTRRHVQMLRDMGVAAEELSPQRCRELEPGLNSGSDALAGGVLLPADGVGNCRQFAQLLRDTALAQGRTRFCFNTRVSGMKCSTDGVQLQLCDDDDDGWRAQAPARAASSDRERMARHDAVVLCTGATDHRLMRGLGWRLPLLPVHGHSITLPLQADGLAPRSAVVDARSGVAITRMGSRLRVTGGFALGQRHARASEEALRPLWQALDRWFPHAAHRSQVQQWSGARPMLPEGPPVIGEAPGAAAPRRLWLNLGHGAHGWTLANGSAFLLADLLEGRTPSIDPAAFSADRWLTKAFRR